MLIVDGEKYLAEIKELIIEYTNSLNRDFSFQNIDAAVSYTHLNDHDKIYYYKERKIKSV